MLVRTNNDVLAGRRVDRKYFLFFQIWKELTDARTIDSYKYRIMNTLSGLRELGEVIVMRLNGLQSTNHNVDECMAECAEIVASDFVLEKHHYPIRCILLKHLNKKVGTDSELRALHYQIEHCFDQICRDYLSCLLDELEDGINSFDDERIVKCAKMCVSNCISDGWSTPALRSLIDVLDDSVDDQTKWEYFRSQLMKSQFNSYSVYIPLSYECNPSYKTDRRILTQQINEILGDMGYKIMGKDALVEANPCLNECRLPEKHAYFSLNVQARDSYSACYKAINNCFDALNMLAFYGYVEPWDLGKVTSWVVDCDSGSVVNLRRSDLFADYDFVLRGKKVLKASVAFMRTNDSEINAKLKASYAYASMGKASGSQVQKYMNTWVALESLCRGDAYDNIILNVLETVPPALCSRYVYKLFRNFLEDCDRCRLDLSALSDCYPLDKSLHNEERVKNIISVFNDEALREELEERCSVNSLLLYRCKEMATLALNPSAMFARIKMHHRSTRRQLSRLYRIRNEIAHKGSTSAESLELFSAHLVNYLAVFVLEFVTRADSMKGKSVGVVFEAIKDNYRAFDALTSGKKQADGLDVLNGLTSTGIMDLV